MYVDVTHLFFEKKYNACAGHVAFLTRCLFCIRNAENWTGIRLPLCENHHV